MGESSEPVFWKLVQVFTSLLTLAVIYLNARFGIRNKQADMIIHFDKQFDELQEKRVELLVARRELAAGVEEAWSTQRIEVEAGMFYDRFWSLQFDQFVGWYEGYVPTRLYVYWAFSRWREFHKPTDDWSIAGHTLVSTLDDLKNRWQNNPDRSSGLSTHVTRFLELMYALRQSAASADIDTLLGKCGPSWLRRTGRRMFGAY